MRTMPMRDFEELYAALQQSSFRRRFRLRDVERHVLAEKGLKTILAHARELLGNRLAPAILSNDGRQTPYRGHPVFIAQHATGTCCRGCLSKWHGIERGRELTRAEQAHAVAAIARWLDRQAPDVPSRADQQTLI